MRILWVCPFFLHPTHKGAQIRTLGTLRELHKKHEIHFAALQLEDQDEGPAKSAEYCSKYYAVRHIPSRVGSLKHFLEVVSSVGSKVPLAISRYCSAPLQRQVGELLATKTFDVTVCDFLASAPNLPSFENVFLFEHNVEALIWERRAEFAPNFAQRTYCRLQASRTWEYEGRICRAAKRVIAVSPEDARQIRERFGVHHVSETATGVDVSHFTPSSEPRPQTDLVFVGSMDWKPNEDGVLYFVKSILPLIRAKRPDCSIAIVGRSPSTEILGLADADSSIHVTGTVPDVRPYLWDAKAAIVPLRIGGGTRLKIYEAMAAKVPVVSTALGAEGLPLIPGEEIEIADDASSFAATCVHLLQADEERRRIADRAWSKVNRLFSWERVAEGFEAILQS